MIDPVQQIRQVFEECLPKVRYGDLWNQFSVAELVGYARIKAKRGFLIGGERGVDDLLDAINLLAMTVLVMRKDA